ncbi:uncharacterized protein LOC110882104 [Helianthus annuus]|uniref:uncharacterized protein LOC110882104 n=1 Tax=Helianthus annuus TaxID=4232 RepID=UPI000B8FD2AA|nr:uncharacterized protein LOC110882104 [Helianthus annuus]
MSQGLHSRLEQLIGLLDNVQISAGAARWKWTADPTGNFSVKSVKKLLKDDLSQVNGFVFEWSKWIPAKVNIHVWRMELNKIPSADALKKRNVVIVDSTCPLCSSEEESVDHLFLACFVASNVWNGVSSWCNIPNIFAFSLHDLLSIHSNIGMSERKKEAVKGIIIIACWSIWRARNNLKFSSSSARIEDNISEIKVLSFLWYSNRTKHRDLDWKDWCSFVNM